MKNDGDVVYITRVFFPEFFFNFQNIAFVFSQNQGAMSPRPKIIFGYCKLDPFPTYVVIHVFFMCSEVHRVVIVCARPFAPA